MPETLVIPVDPLHPDPARVAQAAAVIRAGELVAFPTETVYGLGANALDEAAVERIFAAKERPAADPLIVHIAAPEELEQIVAEVPYAAWRLAERFWPGPLTLVLPKGTAIPAAVCAGGKTVAVRMPAHAIPLALIRAAGVPIAAPSANRFSRPSPTTAQHVLDDLAGRVEIILDGGPTPIGVESTVLDLTADPPTVLRPGGLSLEALRAVLPTVTVTRRYLALDTVEGAASPGMLLKHYSPRAPLYLYSGPPEAITAALRNEALRRAAEGERAGVLIFDEDEARLAGAAAAISLLGPRGDLDQAAARLFAALRELDARGVDAILACDVEPAGAGLAIHDRLLRAAEGKVVLVG
ncbi:MAG: threonylcarbamoyl-AMP synthase [Anaerolineae bacterium]|nr:threonylcarbamoyl-AMP synthase [Anaerolineae bacterium]